MTIGTRRRLGLLAAVVAMGLNAGGCVAQSSGSDPSNPRQLEIVTWLTESSDRDALLHLVEAFGQSHPGIEVLDASVAGEGGSAARAAIDERLRAGNPPDIVQVSAGASSSGYYQERTLLDLSGLVSALGLDEHVRPDLLHLFQEDGQTFAVPVSVYRVNVLWSNRARLVAAGIDPSDPPRDLDDWIDDLQALRTAGLQYPLAVGNKNTQIQVFESVLLSRLGAEVYSALWYDAATWARKDVRDAIGGYVRLLEFSDPSRSARDEAATVNDVMFGNAAYVVMADYAERQFQASGFRLGEQYDAVPVPGTDGIFDIAGYAFAVPTGASHPDSAIAWLGTASSSSGQRVFTVINGSLPARDDVDRLGYPDYQLAAMQALRDDTLVPSLSQGVAASPEWLQGISGALDEFRTTQREPVLLERLESLATAFAARSS